MSGKIVTRWGTLTKRGERVAVWGGILVFLAVAGFVGGIEAGTIG